MKTPNNNQFESVIKVYMRRKRLLKRDIKDALEITYETLEKKFREPKHLDGFDRQRLAKVLDIPIEVIDRAINGTLTYPEVILEPSA